MTDRLFLDTNVVLDLLGSEKLFMMLQQRLQRWQIKEK
jgi:hypothetical protein